MARKLLLFESLENNICSWLSGGFRNLGFETRVVSTVDACLEAVRTSPPDAVLMLTNNVRDNRAFEVAEAIRSVHPRCGFVFLAGCDSDGREGFLAAGYRFRVHYTPPPKGELVRLVYEAMDSPMETFVIPTHRH
jgi:hypothetical protein